MEIRALTDLSAGNLNFFPEMPTNFQACDGAAILGTLAVFAPTARTAELTAAVLPRHRRSGVLRTLLGEAEETLISYGYQDLLFICPSDSAEGQAVAAHWNLPLEHAEILMVWSGGFPSCCPRLTCRPVREEDVPALSALCAEAFGETPKESEHLLRQDLPSGRVFPLRDGLSACASYREGEGGISLYGVVVPPSLRGLGYGKGLMSALLDEINTRYPGRPVVLEVDGINRPALSLYHSCGFRESRRTNYYFMPIGQGRKP